MKIKQGRILYDFKKKKTEEQNFLRKKYNNLKKISPFKSFFFLNNDSRSILDESQIALGFEDLIIFLKNNGYKSFISNKKLFNLTKNDFIEIFNFLLKKIDINFSLEKNFEENFLKILKEIKYPFVKSKNYKLLNKYSQSKSNILVFLKWLKELLEYDLFCKNENNNFFFFLKSNNEKPIWELLNVAYISFFSKSKEKKIFYFVIKSFSKYKIHIKNFWHQKKMKKIKKKSQNFFNLIEGFIFYEILETKERLKKNYIKNLFFRKMLFFLNLSHKKKLIKTNLFKIRSMKNKNKNNKIFSKDFLKKKEIWYLNFLKNNFLKKFQFKKEKYKIFNKKRFILILYQNDFFVFLFNKFHFLKILIFLKSFFFFFFNCKKENIFRFFTNDLHVFFFLKIFYLKYLIFFKIEKICIILIKYKILKILKKNDALEKNLCVFFKKKIYKNKKNIKKKQIFLGFKKIKIEKLIIFFFEKYNLFRDYFIIINIIFVQYFKLHYAKTKKKKKFTIKNFLILKIFFNKKIFEMKGF
jgi:hypothetical protein